MTLITTNTPSNATNSSFTSSIDSTYKLYILKFYDVNPVNNSGALSFQGSTDGGSTYGVTMTSSAFRAYHTEDDATTDLSYQTAHDLAQSINYQGIAWNIGNGADESCAGELFLFNPSNTTYVKHWVATSNTNRGNASQHWHGGGYFNTTSAINAIDFKMTDVIGNFDAVIKMYGVG